MTQRLESVGRTAVPGYLAFRCVAMFGMSFAIALSCFAETTDNVELRFENGLEFGNTELFGVDARLQLLVTQLDGDQRKRDVTSDLVYSLEPHGIVSVDPSGLVTPIADGHVQVSARDAHGRIANISLQVRDTANARPVSFPGQIVPIFTKLGCNGGGCHGKIAGQNGFRLSLLGFEPRDDHKRLVAESRGRRVSVASPESSLLLQKTVNQVPHGGGARTTIDSHEYRMIRRWISQGMPFDSENSPELQSIRVIPESRRLAPESSQQLAVMATYSDGRHEDITRAVVYESNDTQMADVTESGLVRVGSMIGDVAVMARYQGHVAVFQADIPLHFDRHHVADEKFPNLVDHHVRGKLGALGITPSGICDDSTFIRRATLDLCGRLPTLAETQQFLTDDSTDKRDKLLDRLLVSDDYAAFFARKWGVILRNQRNAGTLQLTNVLFYGMAER